MAKKSVKITKGRAYVYLKHKSNLIYYLQKLQSIALYPTFNLLLIKQQRISVSQGLDLFGLAESLFFLAEDNDWLFPFSLLHPQSKVI